MSSDERIVMNSRRQAFALAGALTATLFTGFAAVAGIFHGPAPPPAATTPIVQVAPSQTPAPPAEWGDD